MIYVIKGKEEILIRQQIDKICSQVDIEIIRFDGSDKTFSLQVMLDTCMERSLFASKNIILVKDPYFLIDKCDDNALLPLTNYIISPNYDTDLVLYTYDNKFNTKLKAYKSVCSNAQLFTFDTYDYKQFNNYVDYEINKANLNISKDAINLLNQICRRNVTLFMQNLEVLKNYPDKIDTDVINKLCTASDDINSFELINAITNNNLSKAISLERLLINENGDVLSVIGLLSAQLRFLYHFAYLLDRGYKKNDILEELKIENYRYSKSMETLDNLKMKQIIRLLEDLSKLDIECKSDYTLKDTSRLELFIINLLKNNIYASN